MKVRRTDGVDYQMLGERIRQARQDRSYTQEKLAELADCSPQHISRIENGISGIRLVLLLRISRILHCPLNELLVDSLSFVPKKEQSLEQLLRTADREEKREFRRYLEAMENKIEEIKYWTKG